MGNQIIGSRIEERRKQLGMTLDDVARELGVAKSTIQSFAVQTAADDLLPAEDEVLGLQFFYTLFLQVGFQLGLDGLGGGLQLLLLGLNGLELLDPVLNHFLCHGLYLLTNLVEGKAAVAGVCGFPCSPYKSSPLLRPKPYVFSWVPPFPPDNDIIAYFCNYINWQTIHIYGNIFVEFVYLRN